MEVLRSLIFSFCLLFTITPCVLGQKPERQEKEEWWHKHRKKEPAKPNSGKAPEEQNTSGSTKGQNAQKLNNQVALTGRRIVTLEDKNKFDVLSYVGWISNEKNKSVAIGSGTLIGPRHVITSASVAELAYGRSDTLGEAIFVIDGKAYVIDEVEADGGWNDKLVSMDLALCKLESAPKDGKHAQWRSTEYHDPIIGKSTDPLYGSKIHCSGYDLDVWLMSGANTPPTLIDRSGTVERFSGNKKAFWKKVERITDSVIMELEMPEKVMYPLGYFGLGAGVYKWGEANMKDHYGWESDCIGSTGVSGGPVWLSDQNQGSVVIGVIGQPIGKALGDTQIVLGGLAGSRITEGGGFDMVTNFLGK